ncbi:MULTISPECIES: DUF6790 family protein [unclassified Rhizobium]|uniref:DUF6790 family protein n=1 Tax=unclassified Rhizobium TaxID=2613769 RepID=UPI001ADAFB12|nr:MULTISPECIES: DUF6790 family protein [unclassified Rhizobium]MBO9124008.1 hypothetical protein [Rhizobium sp. 16-488-2b]MBO9174540.1 hypothetical protein [Rhizobium sp. 16-488-2a]
MIADTIRIILAHLPAFLFIAAIICATLIKRDQHWSRRYLSWILLLAVGVDGLWAGIFHVFFPEIASAQIGWQQSPFEFEVGIADTALGAVAVLAFWRSLSFQSAVAVYAVIFYGGVTFGHFVQAFQNKDYAADNFGLLLALTIARAIALSILLWAAWKQSPSERHLESYRARA